MAINFTVSYTFTPGTTISSSQVNTNFSDNANTWTGLEGLTKSFAALRVDTSPTTSTDVAIKSYVDKLNHYRRPVLQFGSVTTVSVESGLDGTSGNIPMLFPDGTFRTETSTTRTTFDITRNAVLSGSAQSGLRTSLSEATNTWYAVYGVKVTDTTTTWVTVGDTVLPLRANFTTLNSNFGTDSWVYLGLIRNGDNSGATGDILSFVQAGNFTKFTNSLAALNTVTGLALATASATATAYSYSAGTGTTGIPNNITIALYGGNSNSAASNATVLTDSSATRVYMRGDNVQASFVGYAPITATEGIRVANSGGGSVTQYVMIGGWWDGVLGVGANPIL